jgi:hypothetical protein
MPKDRQKEKFHLYFSPLRKRLVLGTIIEGTVVKPDRGQELLDLS